MRRIVWFDALTTKQLLIGFSLKRYLDEKGYNVLLTTRDYDVIRGLVASLGIEAEIFGGYKEDLFEKLIDESERIAKAARILQRFREEILAGVSYPNPVEARVMYGINRPYIVLSDSPHSKHPHRLSLPLAKYLVYSSCIPREAWREYEWPGLRVVPYDGFDELAWIKDLPQVFSRDYVKNIGLEEYRYVVARPEESKASYYSWGFNLDFWRSLITRIIDKDLKVILLPRYEDQRLILSRELKDYLEKNLVVIPRPEDAQGPSLVRYSLATITGGGTMSREAALQGVLGITTFPLFLHVDKCVKELRLPLFYSRSVEEIIRLIDSFEKNVDLYKERSREIITTKKSPNEVIQGILRELERELEEK